MGVLQGNDGVDSKNSQEFLLQKFIHELLFGKFFILSFLQGTNCRKQLASGAGF